MKYDIVLEVEGRKFRFKDIEAADKEDAETMCVQQLKKRIKLVSIQPSPAVRTNEANATQIPPISGEDIFRQFFRKS